VRQPPNRTDRPEDLRRRIERLEGLPLRPTTARRILAPLAAEGAASLDPTEGEQLDQADPGWALARATAERVEPLALVAERTWWPCGADRAATTAVERLWRHAVAASCAARLLAQEAGDPDPAAMARAGLLLDLGLWALAAVDPQRLARRFALSDPAERLEADRAWLGCDLVLVARTLAERWGCAPAVVDASWLHDGFGDAVPACAEDPGRLSLIRKAYLWAERTPWALSPRAARGPGPPDPRLRRLLAEVQARCAAGLVAADASPREEELARSLARVRLQNALLLRERAASDGFLVSMAESAATSGTSLAVSTPGPRAGSTTLRLDAPSSFLLPPSPLAAAQRAWTVGQEERARTRRRLEEVTTALRGRVERQERELRQGRLDALAEFAAGAGHELNNPLAVILGRAQLLLARPLDPDASRSLRAIIGQVQRAHRILRDLIYIARPPGPRPRPCQPDEILRACLADLKPEADARQVRLLARTRDPGPRTWADPDALRHLAEVVVRNALEATPAGGTVRVIAGGDARRLAWTVHDGGRGIAPEQGRRLFDPFFCGRQAGRGLGLGLPRAFRFVAAAGGDLRWRSTPGVGTVFHLTLPLSPPCGPIGRDPPRPR
jgi:signal transduction histidine kinase